MYVEFVKAINANATAYVNPKRVTYVDSDMNGNGRIHFGNEHYVTVADKAVDALKMLYAAESQ